MIGWILARPGRCRSAVAPATPARSTRRSAAAESGSCVGIFPEGRVNDDPEDGLQRDPLGAHAHRDPVRGAGRARGHLGDARGLAAVRARPGVAAAAPYDGARVRRGGRARTRTSRPASSASATVRRSRSPSRALAPSPAAHDDPSRRHPEPVDACLALAGLRERMDPGVPRRGAAARRRARCLRGGASAHARGGCGRARRAGQGAARRAVPVHARALLLGDPRGRRADRRGPARRAHVGSSARRPDTERRHGAN